MGVLIRLWGGRQAYLEYAGWAARPDRFIERRHEQGETILWLGRLQVIYTPADWRGRHDRRLAPQRACRG